MAKPKENGVIRHALTTRMSNRQYALLKAFTSKPQMTFAQAAEYDQRAFRSFLIRGYIAYHPHLDHFYVTGDGQEAWRTYQHTDIRRLDPSGPLTAYFDPKLYGLDGLKKKEKLS